MNQRLLASSLLFLALIASFGSPVPSWAILVIWGVGILLLAWTYQLQWLLLAYAALISSVFILPIARFAFIPMPLRLALVLVVGGSILTGLNIMVLKRSPWLKS